MQSRQPRKTYTPLYNPYKSAESAGKVVIMLLLINIVLSIIAMWSSYSQVKIIDRISKGEDIPENVIDENDEREATIGFVQIGLLILTAVFFCIWIYRASANLRSFGIRGLNYTPGWAVGWFFVPFANYIMPYKVTKEIWQASEPTVDQWQTVNPPPLLLSWWIFWIGSNIVGYISFRIIIDAETAKALLNATWLSFVSDLLSIIAAGLAIYVIKGINQNQNEKIALVGKYGVIQFAQPVYQTPQQQNGIPYSHPTIQENEQISGQANASDSSYQPPNEYSDIPNAKPVAKPKQQFDDPGGFTDFDYVDDHEKIDDFEDIGDIDKIED